MYCAVDVNYYKQSGKSNSMNAHDFFDDKSKPPHTAPPKGNSKKDHQKFDPHFAQSKQYNIL
jgi:hypothetical protein